MLLGVVVPPPFPLVVAVVLHCLVVLLVLA